ncbi:MAG: type VI secretion system baseplate subunit TssK [Polyangia bacterium]
MASAHDLPAPIQWHEGMLLAPQHFQQLVARSDRLLHYNLALGLPFHFGVVRLRFDSTLLFGGTLRITELEAVLPDGLVVSFRPGTGSELQIDLRAVTEQAKHEPILLHLAVPAELRGGGQEGELGRYVSVSGDSVTDETTGEQPLRIPRLRPRLRLLAGPDAPPQRYVSLPLLSVRYKNGAFVAAEYIPPLLVVEVDSALGELCARISRRVREKATYLLEVIRSPAITSKPALLEENKRLIGSLAANLLPFEALLATGRVHPYCVYVALCSLAGEIAAVGSQLLPPLFPAYDHLDVRRSFDAVSEFILRSLDEGISEAFTAIPFKLDAGTFVLQFERDWQSRVLILGVKGAPGSSDQQITEWIQSCLIGTTSRFRMLRERRLLGAVRQPIERYEGLVATRGALLFQLTVSPDFIVPGEQLMVGNFSEKPGLVRPAEMSLYVANKW